MIPVQLSCNELDDALERAGYRFADLDEVLASLLQNGDAVPNAQRMAAFGSIYTGGGFIYSVKIENPHGASRAIVDGCVKGRSLRDAGLITIPVVRVLNP